MSAINSAINVYRLAFLGAGSVRAAMRTLCAPHPGRHHARAANPLQKAISA